MQVFLNLFKNAIEAECLGGHIMIRTLFLPVDGSDSNRNKIIEINDTGIVFDEEISLVLTPFYSVIKTDSGFEIPFCRSAVDKHHRSATVESRERGHDFYYMHTIS